MNKTTNTHEMISALADGDLAGARASATLDLLCSDPAAEEAWHCYHVIGDVLRSPDLARATPRADFMQALSKRLAEEPRPVVPVAVPLGLVEPPIDADIRPTAEPANDPVFRWKIVAGAASLAAAFAVSWSMLGAPGAPVGPQLASVPANELMIRDAQLDELLAAHQQLGGAGALQMPASFIREVSFDARNR
ncbi:sigma-E factor negative regulatory protein [Ramlibacter rhizophilus]|uniref:Anti-sigma factor n=1 Tax=Ramlibacter rhizophilus TaxID=1781167 RepID=A0A4Z0BEH2_9BURK|nr:sigma-E factor negative regulatory protein [Ramlibacter rhizophilus]TFY96504.1 anti-sigma factor [Ramlibacter rhizophilus]